jgi:Na+-translocating ferredoxin:NAD+ oxidoreductase RnfC subunit
VSIAEKVKRCGVVGAGGAGFPTHVKLAARADVVIVNGVECEPLLSSDKYIVETESEGIVAGLEALMEACGAKEGYVALKKKHSAPMEAMSCALKGKRAMRVFPVDDFYPAGDELVLVSEITGKIVPEGGIPPQVACLVQNVETVLNVWRALDGDIPVTRRHLTCTGEVKFPSIVKAHIGASIGDIIALCGGASVEDFAVIVGGPLMGSVTTDLDAPVTKTTGGIIVLESGHALVRRKTVPLEAMIRLSRVACCQCSYCTELCPRYLLGHSIEPHRIMRQVGYGLESPAEVMERSVLCSGCGLCEVYACVMGVSPCAVNRSLKARLSEAGVKPAFPARTLERSPMVSYRRVPGSRIVERLDLGRYAAMGLRREIETRPDRVEIPLVQHIGASAAPVVAPGERVEEGALIAGVPEGKVGAAVHASVGGTISLVDDERIIIERAS